MHYLTFLTILAAGSNTASASYIDNYARHELVARAAINAGVGLAKPNVPKPNTPQVNAANKLAVPAQPNKLTPGPAVTWGQVLAPALAKLSQQKNVAPVSGNGAARGISRMGDSSVGTPAMRGITAISGRRKPADTTPTGDGGASLDSSASQTPKNSRKAAMLAKADEMAEIAVEYRRRYKQLAPKDLGNNEPPLPNFELGNRNYGTVNDYSQTAYGGGSNARDGASANQNTQVDNSMNDNRMQVGNGATVSGITTNNSRVGPNPPPAKTKRGVEDSYTVNEDGRVTAKDFTLLVKAMRRNADIKNEALYEFAGVPGMRDMVEQLIQSYTETNGQLTMNNFAALVDAMDEDPDVKQAVVGAFNSSMLYAFLVEKLLTRCYNTAAIIQQQALVRRYLLSETHTGLHARDIDDLEDFLGGALSDEDFWLGDRDVDVDDYDEYSIYLARGIQGPVHATHVKAGDDRQGLTEMSTALKQWVQKYPGRGTTSFGKDGSARIDWTSSGGEGSLKVSLDLRARSTLPPLRLNGLV